MSSSKLCIAIFLSALLGWSQPIAGRFSELLAKAIENNRDLLAVRQRVNEARGILRQAGVRPAPSLDLSGASGRPLGTVGEQQLSAGISREFETAGKRSRRIQLAERQVALAESEHDDRVRQLRYEISTRYVEYAAEEQKLRVLDNLIDVNRRYLDLIRARVAKGDAAALEQNLVAVELSRAEALRIAASGRLEAARADISRLLGLKSGETWSVTALDNLNFISPDGLAERALNQRPDLRILRLIQQQSKAETALVEAEARPNVTVSAGYTRVSSRFDDQFGFASSNQLTELRDRDDILSFGVSVPLFSRNRNSGNLEAAIARTKAAQLRAEYLERAIPLEVDAAWRRLEGSRAALASLQGQAIALGQNNLEVIRQAYQLGQLRLLDVLAEQRRLIDTQLASIDVQAELQRSLAELEKAVGGPIQ